jgi:CheY-like chemotaxis protein
MEELTTAIDRVLADPAPSCETGRGAGAMVWEILVVEDDEDLRESLAEALGANGHIVCAAEHGAKALELLSGECRPGLILLDIVMPVMDGLRFLELKNADPLLAPIPVVMMSATERRVHSGVADLVAKPMDLDDLERVIEQHYESP